MDQRGDEHVHTGYTTRQFAARPTRPLPETTLPGTADWAQRRVLARQAEEQYPSLAPTLSPRDGGGLAAYGQFLILLAIVALLLFVVVVGGPARAWATVVSVVLVSVNSTMPDTVAAEEHAGEALVDTAGEPVTDTALVIPPEGNYHLRGAPSVTAEQVDQILVSYGSPAHGTGRVWVELGERYNIDPAFALAFFIHESSAGTNPNWAGLKPDGSTTHNVGNIICAGYATCYGRFRNYDSWATGIEDWYRLIDVEYIEGRGTMTVAEIIPIYAPAFENDVDGYVRAVETLVESWRAQNRAQTEQGGAPAPEIPADVPHGNPLQAANTLVSQDYNGVFSHTPENVWGALDLIIDGNGNGIADDPGATRNHPVYATHRGVVTASWDTYPAGNHVWVTNDQYRTGYAHLETILVEPNQTVERGTQIGTVGSTGQSSGPHLDYQVWVQEHGSWVNANPRSFAAVP